MHPKLPGLLIVTLLAIPAWYGGTLLPIIGGPVLGILIGMLAAAYPRPTYYEAGINFASKIVLQAAVVLLGFELNLFQVITVGSQSLLLIAATLAAAFITAWLVGRQLGLPTNTTILIGVGTAICGGSAIAATAPVIKASDKEVAYAIATIFLFNVAAVFIFPVAGHLLAMSQAGFGMWAGTAINDTSSVVAAGYSFGREAGDFAVIVKLTRALMIVPIVLSLSFWVSRQQQSASISLRTIFPWFIAGFLLASIINTTGILSTTVTHYCGQAGKFAIILAMTAIGLKTRLSQLFQHGLRPLILGLMCWLAVALVSLTVQQSLNLW